MKPLALLSTIVVAGSLATVACSGTTSEDRERLELLKNDPLFDYAPPGQTPSDATTSEDLLADGNNPISDTTATTHAVFFALTPMDDHRAIMRELEALMIDQGWQDLTASCRDSEIRIFGAKQFDDFVALGGPALTPTVNYVDGSQTPGPGLQLAISAPFHSEQSREIEGRPPETDCLHQDDG